MVSFLGLAGLASAADPVSFTSDVRPILASKCFACHGPDEEARESDLRLDTREGATANLGGYRAIEAGKPKESELIRRISSRDADERMPPPGAEKRLTPEEIETLRRWIAEGAKYERHWAFVPPRRPKLPEVRDKTWPRNAIDRFILARLERGKMKPSPTADRNTLVRRVYLDLIGLPPSPEVADAFANDRDPQAYEKLVEGLLALPQYGERWARRWLDLARYADTNGYEKDRARSIWPYRDWVIDALNADMPFDQFTIEQLAGDMLPGATASQRIATGFQRNTMLNEEGGIDPLEYRFYAMVDRVATTGTVWLGLTTGCCQCHTHKYDPLTHTDYYRLMGLLNNADEPDLTVPDTAIAKRRQEIASEIARLEADLPGKFPPTPGLEASFAAWLKEQQPHAASWTVLRPYYLQANLPKLKLLDDGSVFSSGDITKRDVYTLALRLDAGAGPVTALRLEVLPDGRLPEGGPGRAYYEGRKGDFFLSEITATAGGKPIEFASASHTYGKISIGSGNAKAANVIDGEGSTGWSTAGREGEPHKLVLNLAQPLKTPGELKIEMLFERHFAASLGRFRWSATSSDAKVTANAMPVEVEALLARGPKSWDKEERARVKRHFLRMAPELAEVRKQIDQLRGQLPELPITLVMQERPADHPRQTFRHHRGEYLSPREKVSPSVPQAFPPLPKGQPANRLTFARWLVSGRNPLIGRVTVNRAWQAFFGRGLVVTSEDFGTQSEPPTHPELLDWLACEFVASGWSLKRLHRLLVTSATYRQSSRVTPELLRRDPENRLLARGPRVRVEAEMVRDIVLKASGLLSPKLGGRSVYPPQPASVTALAYGNVGWTPATDADRYRRSLYTFSKRTSPFAAYTVFDAPTGENCIARRDRSNTPLQALTLLNDEMFLEMARSLAKEAVKQPSAARRATYLFRRFLTRSPQASELRALLVFQQAQRKRFDAGDLIAADVGGDKSATPELASWVMVARAVMNLDETITKP